MRPTVGLQKCNGGSQFLVGRSRAAPHRFSKAMDADQLAEKMRARVEQCRRLADLTHNAEIREALLRMAAEGEADIKKLETGRA
jgi:hypothetical protein